MATSKKGVAWRNYQKRVAALFRRMGFDAVVEEVLEGARGKHKVDVVVRTKVGGVPTTWIVECKYWKTSISKAHALTLAQIAQDVGADRALLLSEKGFQAGAIAAVRKTNVFLTRIEELKATAADSIAEISIRQSLTAVRALEHDLRGLVDSQGLRSPPPPLLDETIDLLGACLDVTLVATAALASQFPVRLPTMVAPAAPATTNEPAVVARALDEFSREIRKRADALKAVLSAATSQATDDAEELIRRVRKLLARSDALLKRGAGADAEEAKLWEALRAMRAVGRQAKILREVPIAALARPKQALMRILIDGVYLWIGNPRRTLKAWAPLKSRTEAAISDLSEAIGKARP